MTLQKNMYNTSQDERGYISVYEFTSSNGTIVMWDSECGYVNWTSIRKAMGWSKRGEGRNIMKEMEYVEKTAKDIRKIRGGILKIQGTWIPFDDAYEAAKEYCWEIRHELIQIFGEQFVKEARQKTESSIIPTKRRMTKNNRNNHINNNNHNHNNSNSNNNNHNNQKYNVAELTPPPSDIDNSSSNASTATTTPVSTVSARNKYSNINSSASTTTTRKRRTSTSDEVIEKKRKRAHLKVINSNSNSNTLNSSINTTNGGGMNCIGTVHLKNTTVKTTLKNTIANRNSSTAYRNSNSSSHHRNNTSSSSSSTATATSMSNSSSTTNSSSNNNSNGNRHHHNTNSTTLKNSIKNNHHGMRSVPTNIPLSAAPNIQNNIINLKSSSINNNNNTKNNTNTNNIKSMANANMNHHHRSEWGGGDSLNSNSSSSSSSSSSASSKKQKVQVNLNIETKQLYEAVETALALQTLSMDLGMRPFPSWMNIQHQAPEYKKCLEYPKLTYPSEFEMAGCRFEMVEGYYQKVC